MKFIVFNFIKAIKYWYSHINPCENVIAIIYDKKTQYNRDLSRKNELEK